MQTCRCLPGCYGRHARWDHCTIVPLTLSLTSIRSLLTRTLIDSGSSHCFLDSTFVEEHNIPTTSVTPIGLRLFDGSCKTTITQITHLLVTFPCGEKFNLTFYVTPLDSSCSAVLGYN